MMVIGGRGQGRRASRLVLSSSRWLSVAPLLQAEWSTLMSEELLRQQSYAIKNQLGLLRALERKIPSTMGILLAPRWFFLA